MSDVDAGRDLFRAECLLGSALLGLETAAELALKAWDAGEPWAEERRMAQLREALAEVERCRTARRQAT